MMRQPQRKCVRYAGRRDTTRVPRKEYELILGIDSKLACKRGSVKGAKTNQPTDKVCGSTTKVQNYLARQVTPHCIYNKTEAVSRDR